MKRMIQLGVGAILAFLSSETAATLPLPPESVRGATLYVSRLGDNSDGASWATAFTTIKTALASSIVP